MTYAELFKQVCAELGTETFCIDVKTWRHLYSDGPHIVTQWSIWVTPHHYVGATPEQALKALIDTRKRLQKLADRSSSEVPGGVDPEGIK